MAHWKFQNHWKKLKMAHLAKTSSQSLPLPSLCFSGRKVNKNCHPGQSIKEGGTFQKLLQQQTECIAVILKHVGWSVVVFGSIPKSNFWSVDCTQVSDSGPLGLLLQYITLVGDMALNKNITNLCKTNIFQRSFIKLVFFCEPMMFSIQSEMWKIKNYFAFVSEQHSCDAEDKENKYDYGGPVLKKPLPRRPEVCQDHYSMYSQRPLDTSDLRDDVSETDSERRFVKRKILRFVFDAFIGHWTTNARRKDATCLKCTLLFLKRKLNMCLLS